MTPLWNMRYSSPRAISILVSDASRMRRLPRDSATDRKCHEQEQLDEVIQNYRITSADITAMKFGDGSMLWRCPSVLLAGAWREAEKCLAILQWLKFTVCPTLSSKNCELGLLSLTWMDGSKFITRVACQLWSNSVGTTMMSVMKVSMGRWIVILVGLTPCDDAVRLPIEETYFPTDKQ